MILIMSVTAQKGPKYSGLSNKKASIRNPQSQPIGLVGTVWETNPTIIIRIPGNASLARCHLSSQACDLALIFLQDHSQKAITAVLGSAGQALLQTNTQVSQQLQPRFPGLFAPSSSTPAVLKIEGVARRYGF